MTQYTTKLERNLTWFKDYLEGKTLDIIQKEYNVPELSMVTSGIRIAKKCLEERYGAKGLQRYSSKKLAHNAPTLLSLISSLTLPKTDISHSTHKCLVKHYDEHYLSCYQAIAKDWNDYSKTHFNRLSKPGRGELIAWLESEKQSVHHPILGPNENFSIQVHSQALIKPVLKHLSLKQLSTLIQDYLFTDEKLINLIPRYAIKDLVASTLLNNFPMIKGPRACLLCHSCNTAIKVPQRTYIKKQLGFDRTPHYCYDCEHKEVGLCQCPHCVIPNEH